jgi:hypothetical protein
MVDQTIWFLEGLAWDILVRIQDEYVPADFLTLDMGANKDVPLILGRPFLYTMNAVIYVGSGQIHFQFLGRKVKCAFNGYKANKQVKAVCPKRRSRPTKQQGNKKDKDGNGVVLGQISAGFGSCGFGYRDDFSLIVFGFRAP